MVGYQYNVRVCVTEVGCSWGGTSDTRPSYFNSLNLELREECSRTLGMGTGLKQLGLQADAIGE